MHFLFIEGPIWLLMLVPQPAFAMKSKFRIKALQNYRMKFQNFHDPIFAKQHIWNQSEFQPQKQRSAALGLKIMCVDCLGWPVLFSADHLRLSAMLKSHCHGRNRVRIGLQIVSCVPSFKRKMYAWTNLGDTFPPLVPRSELRSGDR